MIYIFLKDIIQLLKKIELIIYDPNMKKIHWIYHTNWVCQHKEIKQNFYSYFSEIFTTFIWAELSKENREENLNILQKTIEIDPSINKISSQENIDSQFSDFIKNNITHYFCKKNCFYKKIIDAIYYNFDNYFFWENISKNMYKEIILWNKSFFEQVFISVKDSWEYKNSLGKY